MTSETIDYTDGTLACEAFVSHDASISGKRPVVLVFHAWAGQDDFARSKAEFLAQLGYHGVAVDMYGKGRRGHSTEENAALMGPFMQDRGMLLRRAVAAMDMAKRHPLADDQRIGAIGFCFGGLCALDLARARLDGVKGVVSFHGLLSPPNPGTQDTRPMSTRVLVCHGWNDPFAKPADMLAFADEMTRAGCDWNAMVFGSRGHAFTNPLATDPSSGMQFCMLADRRAFACMKDFLHECFVLHPSAAMGACPVPA